MSWYYNLGDDAPAFSFTRDNGTTENFGQGGSQRFETTSTCEMVRFIQSHVSNPQELERDFFENLETASQTEGCPINFSTDPGVQPQQPPVNPPVEANPSTVGGDSAGNQGAPVPPVSGSVGTTPPDGGTNPNPVPTEEPTRPVTGEEHDTHGGERPHQQTDGGDPVDIFNGALYLQETDLVIPNALLPMAFTRFYRSGAASFGPFGWNWDHNFNLFIRELNTGNIALWRNLHEDIFTFDGANYEPPRGIFEKLERLPGPALIFQISGSGGSVMHFERPAGWIDAERIPIMSLKDRHGNTLSFTYGAEDKLAEVRDDNNRFFRFDYDQCGLLVAVTDHAGRKYLYDHDEETMQLVCVISPPISGHPDGIRRLYHYEQPWALPELRHNILRIEDGNGNVYLENTYEQDPASWSFARVTEQLFGGFLYQFRYTQLQWVPPNPVYINIPAVQVEIMNPDYGLETYTFNYRGDLLDRRYRLNKDKSFRVVVWQYEFDAQGNLSIVTKPDGAREINTFDFNHPDPRMRGTLLQKELTSASGFPAPSRIIWNGKYDLAFQLLREEKDERGAVTKYRYDFDVTPAAPANTGKLVEIIYPDATLPDGTIQQCITRFENNAKGQITATIQANGVRQEMQYGNAGNEAGRLVKQIFDAGQLNIEHTFTFDAVGNNTGITDGNGYTGQNFYNALGLIERSVLPAINGSTPEYRFHYNADKKISAYDKPKGNFSDPLLTGNVITDVFENDALGYFTKYVLSSNTSEARTYLRNNDFRGLPVETINPDGSRIRKIFDERGLLIEEKITGTDGEELIAKKTYDRSGKLIQEKNTFGLITRYEYDGFSRVAKVILSNGTEIRNKWLKGDLLESEEVIGDDGTGAVRQLSFKSFSYDEKGRKTEERTKSFATNPAVSTNVVTRFFYDTIDRIEKTENNRGGATTFRYDGLGRLVVKTDPLGNEEHCGYDNNGNVIRTENHHIEPDGSVSVIIKQFAYDPRNRKIESIEPDGAKLTETYDDRNLLVLQTDYTGVQKQMEYNSFSDKKREVRDPGGLNIIQQWEFDSMSRTTSYTDPAGQISRFYIDSLGRVYRNEYPNGFVSKKTFNALSQIVREELGSGAIFEYKYDAANRLTEVKNTIVPSGILPVSTHVYSYDGLDRVIAAGNSVNAVQRNFDSQNRLLSESSAGVSISCRYDDAAGWVEKSWPDGRTERYHHDLNGILSTVEETVGGTLGDGNNLIATFKPSGPGNSGEALYQGTRILSVYDERKRLTELSATGTSGGNQVVKYRYDVGNRRRVEYIQGQNSSLTYFDFDAKDRLNLASNGFDVTLPDASTQAQHDADIATVGTAAGGASVHDSFEYNAADARTKYSRTGNPDMNYTFLPGHKIQNDGSNNYTYHTDGSLRSDGQFSYEADALGRILLIKLGTAVICEISYDVFGRPQTVKEAGKPDRSFHYLGGFVEQQNEGGIAVRQFTLYPGTGLPIAYHSAAGTHYTFFDTRHNLLGLFDPGGALLETYRYKAFGLPTVYDAGGTPVPSSGFGVEPVFGSQKYLSSAQLYLSKKRLMNPVNGVFLSPDPKGYEDSPSLYVYAAQNPVTNIDPNGEVIPFIVAAFVIGGALAGAGYSAYDAYHHPDRYEGWQGSLRVLGNVFGGAAIGGVAVVGGELVLAAGGTGIFATGGTAATLTTAQTFTLYGTASAVGGSLGRYGFNNLFPEYIDPVSAETIAADFVIGGAIPVAGTYLREIGSPIANGAREMFNRAIGGNWRAFGNTGRLLTNPRIQYNWRNLFWNPNAFRNVSRQYWRVSGGANGNALHHLWFQNQSRWVPQGLRNAGFNLLEIPGSLNTWMGGRLGRELAFRGIVTGILTGTGVGSYSATSGIMDWLSDDSGTSREEESRHPNEIKPTR